MDNLNLNKQIKWYQYVLLYFYWFITVVLAFVTLFVSRTAFRYLLFNLAVSGLQGQAMTAFLEKFFVLVVGLVILGFIIFTQDYFYKAVEQNLLSIRFLRILGIEFLVLFLFNIIIVLFSPERGILLLFPALELIIGVVLTLYSSKLSKKRVH